jgi:hypothetical protein
LQQATDDISLNGRASAEVSVQPGDVAASTIQIGVPSGPCSESSPAGPWPLLGLPRAPIGSRRLQCCPPTPCLRVPPWSPSSIRDAAPLFDFDSSVPSSVSTSSQPATDQAMRRFKALLLVGQRLADGDGVAAPHRRPSRVRLRWVPKPGDSTGCCIFSVGGAICGRICGCGGYYGALHDRAERTEVDDRPSGLVGALLLKASAHQEPMAGLFCYALLLFRLLRCYCFSWAEAIVCSWASGLVQTSILLFTWDPGGMHTAGSGFQVIHVYSRGGRQLPSNHGRDLDILLFVLVITNKKSRDVKGFFLGDRFVSSHVILLQLEGELLKNGGSNVMAVGWACYGLSRAHREAVVLFTRVTVCVNSTVGD